MQTIIQIKISPNGKFVVLCTLKGFIIFDAETNSIISQGFERLYSATISSCWTKDSQYFVAANNNKDLILFDCQSSTLFQLRSPRKFFGMCSDIDSIHIICYDKQGEVVRIPIQAFKSEKDDLQSKIDYLMGSKSMITCISLSPDGKYLATSDKDEKIRISSYPDTYNILSYCFGHTESISQLDWINENEIIKEEINRKEQSQYIDRYFLLSGALDGTLRLWIPNSGQQIGILYFGPLMENYFINSNIEKCQDEEIQNNSIFESIQLDSKDDLQEQRPIKRLRDQIENENSIQENQESSQLKQSQKEKPKKLKLMKQNMKPSDISLSVLSISIAHILPNKHIIAVVREGIPEIGIFQIFNTLTSSNRQSIPSIIPHWNCNNFLNYSSSKLSLIRNVGDQINENKQYDKKGEQLPINQQQQSQFNQLLDIFPLPCTDQPNDPLLYQPTFFFPSPIIHPSPILPVQQYINSKQPVNNPQDQDFAFYLIGIIPLNKHFIPFAEQNDEQQEDINTEYKEYEKEAQNNLIENEIYILNKQNIDIDTEFSKKKKEIRNRQQQNGINADNRSISKQSFCFNFAKTSSSEYFLPLSINFIPIHPENINQDTILLCSLSPNPFPSINFDYQQKYFFFPIPNTESQSTSSSSQPFPDLPLCSFSLQSTNETPKYIVHPISMIKAQESFISPEQDPLQQYQELRPLLASHNSKFWNIHRCTDRRYSFFSPLSLLMHQSSTLKSTDTDEEKQDSCGIREPQAIKRVRQRKK